MIATKREKTDLAISFWRWLFRGTGAKPGYKKAIDKWLPFHFSIGVALSLVVPISLSRAANAVLLPLAGIFVGLSFAWAGNAIVLLQSKEIGRLSNYLGGGFPEYVFTFQFAILTIITCLALWGLAALGVFDKTWPTRRIGLFYFSIKTFLYSFSSLTLRECWTVVVGAQSMLLLQKRIKEVDEKRKEEGEKDRDQIETHL